MQKNIDRKNFIWGAATAAYQIEGAAYKDGRGLSVWDTCSSIDGFVKDGHTGDVACDHYHRYKEDVKLMKEIGLEAYRMSISWPRVLPEGRGKVNQKGLDFYDKLVDELLENGIDPYITLFHWDYPLELFNKGGWLNSDSSDWFAEYTQVVAERLSDRVTNWITQNEPQCYINLGHFSGEHAPGLKLSKREVLLAGHNSLLAHGKSVQVLRKYSKSKCDIGYAPVGIVAFPDTDTKEDIAAAKSAMFSCSNQSFWNNTWWMDPVLLGKYPEDGLKAFEEFLPKIKNEDLKLISEPIDFLGLNIYHGTKIKAGQNGTPNFVEKKIGADQTLNRWSVTPESLYWGPKFFYERYGKPILITENGMSNIDWVSLDGKVHDPQRIDFLARYIGEFQRAIKDGVEAKGYFCWSLMDNFEWAEGYNERFGLIYVDYATGKRTIKDSGYWYKNLIEKNRI